MDIVGNTVIKMLGKIYSIRTINFWKIFQPRYKYLCIIILTVPDNILA